MFELIHEYKNSKFYTFKNYNILDININNNTHIIYIIENNKTIAQVELLNYTDRIIEHNLIIYNNTLNYDIINKYANFVTDIYE